ncbi:MAG: hypothetical protein U9P79_06065 [Candidatus Cloacimonadota bacterium]|nr:hypothetical protein [Candidatus Cloacimonadota bacterium]
MPNLISLQQLIEKEYFIQCPFLATGQFISYCKERSVDTSREQLEQLEKLKIFTPFVRVKIPKIKTKIEYIENGTKYKDLGILKNDEKWEGDIKEEYAHFWFEKSYAENWLEEGILWDPLSREFTNWENFYDHDRHEFIISYYSIFQCYTLYNIIRSTKMELRAEWWYTYSSEDIIRLTGQISNWAKNAIDAHKKNGARGEKASIFCQILSNRYFPKTQTDRRTVNLSIPSHYHDWSWHEYCRNWNPNTIVEDLGIDVKNIEKLHQLVSLDAKFADPLERWYGLISFVSLEQKKKLKGKALLAQLLYSMEHMIRLFYKELTGEKLFPPNENITWKQDKLYGDGVTNNDLQYLEFLANQYHLNPRPKLILVVEGEGEEAQFPRLSNELFGYLFSKLGIEIVNIHGVPGFTGKKGIDKYGALEKFIDFNHNRQTIVYIVLDKEGRTTTIKNKLIKTSSKFYSGRYVTKSEYIHLWERKTIEFDNFSYVEIAQAMSELSKGAYLFIPDEIEKCERQLQTKEADYLSRLFNEKTGYDLPKPELLRLLCDYIIENAKNEFDNEGIPLRPVLKVLHRVIELATLNHQPTRFVSWEKNQESGYLGDVKE